MTSQEDLFLKDVSYCFDASSLFNLRNFYPEDIFKSINTQFTDILRFGKICIINMVLDELKRDSSSVFYDHIKVNIHKKRIFKYEDYISTTQELIKKYYDKRGKSHELMADPHIIACAKVERIAVVTDELGGSPVQIPNICTNENIECISIVDFFRKESIKS